MSEDSKKWIRREKGNIVVFVPKNKLLLLLEKDAELEPMCGPEEKLELRIKRQWEERNKNSETPE